MSDGDVAPVPGFMEQIGVNVVEFGVLAAFWVGVAILTSLYGLEDVLGTPRRAVSRVAAPIWLPS